jgi:hypothetical protein
MTTRAMYLATAANLALGAFAAPSAQAGYVVTLEDVGSNVVATGSGPIDLTGLSLFSEAGSGGFNIGPSVPLILTGAFDAFAVYSGVWAFELRERGADRSQRQ